MVCGFFLTLGDTRSVHVSSYGQMITATWPELIVNPDVLFTGIDFYIAWVNGNANAEMPAASPLEGWRRLLGRPPQHVAEEFLTTSSFLTWHTLSPFYQPFSRWTWVSRYQNVSVLDFIGAKDDGCGGDSWSYKTCKAPVISSAPANQHPTFHKPDALPVAQPNSVRALNETWRTVWSILTLLSSIHSGDHWLQMAS